MADLSVRELAELRAEFGCSSDTPGQARACAAIEEWQRAAAEPLEPGVYPGIALLPARTPPEVALLVVREQQGRRFGAWSVVRPVNPAEAAALAPLAADLLAEQVPSLVGTPVENCEPEAGSGWLLLTTTGASTRVSETPPLMARRSGGHTFVIGTSSGSSATPLVAVHTRVR